MFLRGIAIYSDTVFDEKQDVTNSIPIQRAPQSAAITLFSSDPLVKLQESLITFTKSKPATNQLLPYQAMDEFHYFIKLAVPSIVVGIASKTKIIPDEMQVLLHNIKLIHIHKEKMLYTLADIINDKNQKYTSQRQAAPKNEKIQNIEKALEETREIMFTNIQKMIDLRDKTDELQHKSVQLEEMAKDYEKKTKKLKPCCSYL